MVDEYALIDAELAPRGSYHKVKVLPAAFQYVFSHNHTSPIVLHGRTDIIYNQGGDLIRFPAENLVIDNERENILRIHPLRYPQLNIITRGSGLSTEVDDNRIELHIDDKILQLMCKSGINAYTHKRIDRKVADRILWGMITDELEITPRTTPDYFILEKNSVSLVLGRTSQGYTVEAKYNIPLSESAVKKITKGLDVKLVSDKHTLLHNGKDVLRIGAKRSADAAQCVQNMLGAQQGALF